MVVKFCPWFLSAESLDMDQVYVLDEFGSETNQSVVVVGKALVNL